MWIFPEANQKYFTLVSWDLSVIIDSYFDAMTDVNGYDSIVVMFQKGVIWGLVKEQISFTISEVIPLCVCGKWKLCLMFCKIF